MGLQGFNAAAHEVAAPEPDRVFPNAERLGDPRRRLGSEVGFEIPGLGTFYGPNLTPDKETGLGGWTDAEIMTAFQTGTRPDGRLLAPLTRDDAQSVVAYLRSLPPVNNKVPGPFGPGETPTSFVSKIVPPGAK